MGPLDSCNPRDVASSFCCVVVQVVGPIRAVLVDNCCACLVFCLLISVRFCVSFSIFYVLSIL